ncbi:MAG: glycosyltransferase family 2 protein [Candidatus Kapaibacterium sp.]|nr:MAG: glycosyltransferase family 2 protein [Candidatus Kapabacteria bacterium]
MNELVSIIIPNYNSEKYIAETLESVLRQSYSIWELLVVDDCSSDGSPAIIQDFAERDKRIRLIRLEKPSGGPAHPRNIGLDNTNAQAKYVAFLDSDDVWHPQKLELQLGAMAQHHAAFCSTAITRFRASEELHAPLHTSFNIAQTLASLRVQEIPHSVLIRKNIIPNSSVLAERRLFEGIRFHEAARYKAIEDFHCWLMVHQSSIERSIKISPRLLFYRMSDTSISRVKTQMVRKHWMLYQEYRFNGKPLGLEKLLYMGTYAFSAITNLLGLRVVHTLDHVTPTK